MHARRISALIEQIVDLQRDLADSDDEVEAPAGPASPAAIEAVEAGRGRRLPPAYRTFLGLHDGWAGFDWGMRLVSTAALTGAAYQRGYLDEADEVPEELDRALVIGISENDASLVLLLEDGAVVEWLYEETARHGDFVALLESHRDALRSLAAQRRAARAAVEAEWTAPVREADEAALLAELAGALAAAEAVAAPTPPLSPAAAAVVGDGPPQLDLADRPAPVDVTDLVVAGEEPGEIAAEVTLTLTLYLGAAPRPDEIARAYRAFRRAFPVPGRLEWIPAEAYSFGLTEKSDDPDDASFVDDLRIDGSGHFGVRTVVTPPSGRPSIFNLRRVPPTDGQPPVARAGFCEVILPATASAGAVVDLAAALLEILPVRSGHAGYTAQLHGDGDEAARAVFAWTRRFFALDLGRVDGWLEAMRSRLRGAAWLTLLGPTFSRALGDRLGFPEGAGVEVIRTAGGTLLRAGRAPILADLRRGDGAAPIAAVARALAPLSVDGYREISNLYLAGNAFQTTRDELPPLMLHRATVPFMRRYLDPDGWLGPTPLEEGEARLAAACALGDDGARWWKRWEAEPRDSWRAFETLLTLLGNAACADLKADAAVAALELAARHDAGSIERAVNNLLIAYHLRGELARARAFLPRALAYAAKNPYILHSAACVLAVSGDLDSALAAAVRARDLGYEKLAAMRDDADLAPLLARDEFLALFRS